MENEILRDMGFSEREAKVYISLLSLGETTVGPIASKTRIQHSKIYQTLEKLIDRGLVTFVIKSRTKYFSAQNPKIILNMIREKERKFLDILPDLQKKAEFSKKPQIATVYEGYKAIKSMFETVLDGVNENSFYYVFAFRDEYLDSPMAKRFLCDIHSKLSQKRTDDRLIANISIRKEIRGNYSGIKGMKIRFTKTSLPFGLMIIGNRVINWIWGERPTAVEIVSDQIASQYKKFFLDIWAESRA